MLCEVNTQKLVMTTVIVIVVKFIELHSMMPISGYLLTYSLPQFINYTLIHSWIAVCEMLSGRTNPLQDRKTSFVS